MVTVSPVGLGDERARHVLHVATRELATGLGADLWSIVVFGSAARGEAVETSDIDVLMIVDHLPVRFTDRMRFLRSFLPSEAQGVVSLIAKTREEFEAGFPSYYFDVAVDGVILVDRAEYIRRKLERIRALIRAAGLSRRRIEGGFLWQWAKAPRGHWRIDWNGVVGL